MRTRESVPALISPFKHRATCVIYKSSLAGGGRRGVLRLAQGHDVQRSVGKGTRSDPFRDAAAKRDNAARDNATRDGLEERVETRDTLGQSREGLQLKRNPNDSKRKPKPS
ncbi:unnamed protein product [Arctogadus glacialis]